MLLRIHQSGHLAELPEDRIQLVKEGIACYKNIRSDIKESIPFLPLDIADNEDLWVCGGIQVADKAYLAVWKREMEGKSNQRRKALGQTCSDTSLTIPLNSLPFAKEQVTVSCIYPSNEPVQYSVKDQELQDYLYTNQLISHK